MAICEATGPTAIFLFDAGKDAPLSTGRPSSIHHLGFVVDNLEHCYAHLHAMRDRFASDFALLERDGIQWADSCAAQGHPMIERLWRDARRMVSINIAIGGPARRTAFRLLKAYETRPRS